MTKIPPYLSVFSPNAGKCGKNADQNNSEYVHFLCSVILAKSSNCVLNAPLGVIEKQHVQHTKLCPKDVRKTQFK